jgi:preprotein translocase subunit SecA
MPADQPIEMRLISKSLESAQTRIEGFHFDSRKQILAYDDVLNKQRQQIYAKRRRLLMKEEGAVEELISELLTTHPHAATALEQKRQQFGAEEFDDLLRRAALQLTDMLWVDHLEAMAYTRNSVRLRAYGQRDPLIEYRKEGTRLFSALQETLLSRLAEVVPTIEPKVVAATEEQQKAEAAAAQKSSEVASGTAKSAQPKTVVKAALPGRNDVVTITNGADTETMKYKKAEPLLAKGWKLVS